jgi:hypothetical protein
MYLRFNSEINLISLIFYYRREMIVNENSDPTEELGDFTNFNEEDLEL